MPPVFDAPAEMGSASPTVPHHPHAQRRIHLETTTEQQAQLSRLHSEASGLRGEMESRERLVAELRQQITELLPYKTEAATMRRQLSLLDERVKARDVAQQAKVEELNAKLRLYETVEGQLEGQVMRVEEERLRVQKRLAEQLDEANARTQEAVERMRVTEVRAEDAEAKAERSAAVEKSRATHEKGRLEGELQAERSRSGELREQVQALSEKLASAQREVALSGRDLR